MPPFWGPACHRKQRTALSLQMVKQPALASWTRRLSSLTAVRSLHFISCKTLSTAGPLFYVPRRKKNTDNWVMQRFLYHFELCTTYRRRWFLLDICVCDISLFCIQKKENKLGSIFLKTLHSAAERLESHFDSELSTALIYNTASSPFAIKI